MCKVLYGCESDNCAAYCKLHKCNLTVKQIRGRECLQKQCFHFVKNEHPYWRQKEKKKMMKKMNKMKQDVYYNSLKRKEI